MNVLGQMDNANPDLQYVGHSKCVFAKIPVCQWHAEAVIVAMVKTLVMAHFLSQFCKNHRIQIQPFANQSLNLFL